MRVIRKLTVSAVTCAMALGAVAATAAQPAAATAPCVPTQLIGVHGTGEETGVIGNELASLYNGVVARTGLPEQGLQGWQDDSSLLVQLAAGILLIPTLGTAALNVAVSNLQSAVNSGATDLYNQVTSEESQCPGEHFVIAGFSQGAMVVGQFARAHPELAGTVSGIIMWADPEFNGNDPLAKGAVPNSSNFTGTGGWLGIVGWYYNQRYVFPSAWNGRLHSYCTTLDPVCNWSQGNATNLGDHGDENTTPIISDSESAIQADGSGWAPSVWDRGSATFYTTWQRQGGASGSMGQPAADPVSKPGSGLVQTFAGHGCGSTGSAIMWSPSSGTHVMWGCLYNGFVQKYGGPGGAYGYPVTDEQATAGGTGRVNHMSGTLCGSVAGSGLYYSPAGAWPVHGCIYQRYEQIGEDGSGVGLPASDEYAVSGGVQQNFSGGFIRDINGVVTVTIRSGGNLDNTDPYTSGCAGSAHPETTVASTTDGPTAIYLQWSGYCGTNWTRVVPNITSNNQNIEMAIWVERQEANGTITQGDVFRFWPGGTVPAWSDQLYSPVLHARACENYWNRYDKVWSTPVCTGWV